MSLIADFLKVGLDKFVVDANAKLDAQVKLAEAEKNGELQEFHDYMEVLKTEAASDDNYTRRARPTALYIIYVLLCWGLVASFVAIFSPSKAQMMIDVFTNFFAKMPEDFFWTIGSMFGIYSGARTFEKIPTVMSAKGKK